MYEILLNRIKDKSIAILGFGKEGISTYNFIRKHLNNKLTIIDQNTNLIKVNEFLKKDNNVDYILGEEYLEHLDKFDIIFKSPGIKIPDEYLEKIKDKITSQIEVALELFKNNIIGITGTKGKSTTSSLLYKVFKDQNKDCILLGNVGYPVFDYIEQINKDTILVIEMSSYQLDLVKHSPHISVILNLFEDHLNYHETKEKYHYAKLNILKYQSELDYALYSGDNEYLIKYIKHNDYKSNFINIDNEFYIDKEKIYYNDKEIYNKNDKRLIIGEHNLKNILFVLKVALMYDLDLDIVRKSINEFKPLEHRMEYIGELNGVKYYDDSIATIPEATINCIEALNNVDTLIFGGLDRGINYDLLIDYLNKSKINNFICMPETGHKLSKYIKIGNVYIVDDLESAVKKAKEVTKVCCLLSPSAPSYNAFKNFEEKGKAYKELIFK